MPRRRALLSLHHAVASLIVLTGLGLACGKSSTEPASAGSAIATVAANVAQVAAAVTGQPAPMAEAQLTEKHMGFDTHTYPGDRTMRAWKNAPGAPYKWVGYYLPSPCHKDPSWVGRREALTDMGWGIAIVYVGQQTWGRNVSAITDAQRVRLERSGATCNAGLLGSARGAKDADDAIAAATREGFAPRSIVFLDVERMERMPPSMRAYYRAWAHRLLEDGRYRPGVYVHAHNAQVVHDDFKEEFVAAGIAEEPRIWIATGHGYEEGKGPQDVGFTFAGVWQGMIDVARRVADIKLPVDVNVSSWSSPSEPEQQPGR